MDVDEIFGLREAGDDDGSAGSGLPHPDASSFSGRRVLITGAGGSIGSALCRAVAVFPVERLAMLDRDDSALHALQLDLAQLPEEPALSYHLRDICDEDGLRDLFRVERPHVVLHAAALKQVPLLEDNPTEAYRVNVLGTQSVLRAAAEGESEVFVNVSTDKASNPTTVLGATKRLGERLTSYFNASVPSGRRFVSVRFGNVVGSRGSFLPIFVERIRQGRPVLVTHADATRFLMSTSDAVALTLFAAAHGRGGETVIARMGRPVRILDIARYLVERTGSPLPIEITGLRPGDKLHEDYNDDSELPLPDPAIAGVVRVSVEPLDPRLLRFEEVRSVMDANWSASRHGTGTRLPHPALQA